MIFNVSAGEVKTLPIVSDKYPEDITVKAGENAVFSAVIEKDGIPTEYTYQWYVNNSLVSGATTAVYTRKTDSDKGVYSVYCEITNKAGVVKTRTATLTVNALPKLDSTKLEDVSCYIGDSKTFEVSISEHGYPKEYTYQWYMNGSKISGATSPSYTFIPSTLGSTKFYCEVTNIAGTVISRTATITSNTGYFYNNGSVNTALTGGMSAVAQQHSSSTWPKYAEVTYGSNFISLLHVGANNDDENRSSAFYVNNAINLSNVKTISINVSLQDGDTYWTDAYLFVTDSKTTQIVNYIAKMSIESVRQHVLDVSSLTGNYYVGIMLAGKWSCRINFTEWKISS